MAYKKGDYAKYHKSPRMKIDRAARNKNRKTFQAGGKVRKGDGKHIDHKDGNPKNNSPRNLKVVPARRNRKKQ
jgi:hypothetical protein|tara:strand:+ start:521 stop:739 length:219 start_codon:yes stop_codon:yes gene_type:complete